MNPDRLNRLWLLFTGMLVLIIIICLIVVWFGRDKGQEVILLPLDVTENISQYISVEGAVANPGSFPLRSGDTIGEIIDAAGGFSTNADSSGIIITVPQNNNNTASSQKIDINRAEVWLLQALPGIGEVKAQAIVDYRKQNGPFRNIEEIMKVPGLNQSTFDKIKTFISVSEYQG
jgi:competence protein ComEA